MPQDLDRATRLTAESNRYSARLSEDWEIWGPNGGYLAAIALRAAGEVAEIERSASFYCHFLSSPAFDGVELEVRVLKQGRRAESFAVEMTQQGKPILHAMVKTAAEAPGYSHQHPSAPAVPLPETLKTYEELFPASPRFSFWENVERRPVEQSTTDEPQAPLVRAWVRFRPTACFEDPFLDAARALILLDTYGFPAAYRKYRSWEYSPRSCLATGQASLSWAHRERPGNR